MSQGWRFPEERTARDGAKVVKPRACACGKPNPNFNRDGGRGPWRCRACHEIAEPLPPYLAAPIEPRAVQQASLI